MNKKPGAKGKVLLYLQSFVNGERSKRSLGLSVEAVFFDKTTGLIRDGHPEANDLNIALRSKVARANKIVARYRIMEELNEVKLTKELFEREFFTSDYAKGDFLKWYEDRLNYRYTKKIIEYNTYKGENTTLNKLKEFKKKIRFADLTVKFMNEINLWMIDKGDKQNTRWNLFKHLRAYLKVAKKDGLFQGDPFDGLDVKSVEGPLIFIERKELTGLVKYYRGKKTPEEHKKVLKYFLFSCFTGLRISDVQRVKFDNLVSGSLVFIAKKNHKKGKFERVPLSKSAKEFIKEEKFGEQLLFDVFTDQETNRVLKEIAGVLEIKKHITFHIARHSFATLYLELGGQVQVLQTYLGHSKITTTMKYVHEPIKEIVLSISHQLGTVLRNKQTEEKLKESESALRALNANLEQIVELRTLELKDREDRLRIAVESTELGTWDFNPITKKNVWNDRCKELFGFAPNTEVTYDMFLERVYQEDKAETDEAVQWALNPESKGIYNVEYRTVKQVDHQERWLRSKGKAYFDGHGKAYRLIGTVLDITESKRAMDSLVKANKELKKINADLDSFIYTASHDLKAPVSNIEGLINTLCDTLKEKNRVDEDINQLIGMIDISIKRFQSTIRDLTEISKIQRNINEDIVQINVSEAIQDVIAGIHELIEKNNAIINVNTEKCPGINFSRINFRSIILNLEFQDNGLGIREEHKDKIFEMFKRIHYHVEGTGIGLYLVKRIVDNAEGKIEVESEEGKGSTFRIYLKDKNRLMS